MSAPRTSVSSTIQISGDAGGGQLLRSALSLALVTGQRFRMTNIRGKRPKPGLMRQHLTAVTAAAEICEAAVDGAELGSTELVFAPAKVRGGDYQFAIGSGGSTTLVLQTLLPALLHADGPSTVRIEGGTHNPMAPPFEFIDQCFLPILRGMGAEARVTLERPGFMQVGGGALFAETQPSRTWRKLELLERGGAGEVFGLVAHAHLHRDIAEREIAEARNVLGWERELFELRFANESAGPGSCILLGARFANVSEISSGVALMGKSAESVAHGPAKGLRTYLAGEAPVGAHLADQLLLPMALAGGGVFRTLAITEHTRTNMALIEQFLPLRFGVVDLAPSVKEVSCG